jgi:hypothetical protein
MSENEYIHGGSEVITQNEIIIVRLSGVFNELGVKKFTDAVRQFVGSLDGNAFGILINDLKLEGGTPEAYAELEVYNQWLNTQRLVAKAMVIESSTHKDIINKLSTSRYQQNIEYFSSEQDALTRLKQELHIE